MLQVKQTLKGRISGKSNLKGKLNNAIEYVYPDLEDLEVTPSGEEQKFKSEKYGYNEVTVKAIESEELNITPSTENQEYVGMYKKVTVVGEPNLVEENIVQDKEIFGVKGSAKVADFMITDAYHLCYNGHRQAIAQQLINMCGAITNAYGMLYGCSNLTEIDVSKIDTSQCTSMFATFYGCRNLTELDISNFDTSKVTSMEQMFRECEKVTELDVSNFDTRNVTSMAYMFYYCMALTELDVSNFDTSKVTGMQYMFGSCNTLSSLDLSNFDTSKATSIQYMFYGCTNLKNLKSFKNLGKGYTRTTTNYSNYTLDLSTLPLTHESLIDLITNGLYDLNLTYNVANGGTLYTQSLKLGSTNLAKLTAEEIAIGTAKGWNIT